MRQGLMIGARPRFVKGKPFPQVPLLGGAWRIESENHDGTKIQLIIYKPTQVESGVTQMPSVMMLPKYPEVVLIQGPAVVSAEIVEAGTEEFISIYAYKV